MASAADLIVSEQTKNQLPNTMDLKSHESNHGAHPGVSVIVPAAGRLSHMGALGNIDLDSSFMNIGTKLAIERIVSFFSGKPNVNVLLGVLDSETDIFKLRPFDSTMVVGVGNTSNPCETILKLLNNVTSEWCVINPITAIPTSHLSAEGAIYFGHEQIPKENWSSMTIHGPNSTIFHPKDEHISYGLLSFPFTGRIYAKKTAIIDAIQSLSEDQKNDLIHLASILIKGGSAYIRFEKWLDAGHESTYADSKLIEISSRFFNSLSFDRSTNTIKKRSTHKSKVELEGRFYAESPLHTRRYFPVVLDSTDKGDYWELTLEYIGYPSLAEVFLYQNPGLNTWRRVINALGRVFDDFYGNQPSDTRNVAWLYSEKTSNRLRELEKILCNTPDHCLHMIYDHGFKVNTLLLPSLREGFALLSNNLTSIEAMRPLHIGHGDLCFNNILIDPIYGILKLIDPKAALDSITGKCGLIDPLYDLSKLNHSFTGLYDSVVNNLYSLTCNGKHEYSLQIFVPDNYEYIASLFQNEFLLERIDESVCTQTTASLFLSMLPLHSDDPERMLVLAIIGLTLLSHGKINLFHLKK